jgi:hypothetical protein
MKDVNTSASTVVVGTNIVGAAVVGVSVVGLAVGLAVAAATVAEAVVGGVMAVFVGVAATKLCVKAALLVVPSVVTTLLCWVAVIVMVSVNVVVTWTPVVRARPRLAGSEKVTMTSLALIPAPALVANAVANEFL